MKKIITALLLTLICMTGINAQTRPQQSMYIFNFNQLNPAATGIEDYGKINTGLRRQWVGIDGAPTTMWISGDMHLSSKDETGADNDPELVSKGHGVGFNIYNDKIGPYSSINLNLGYAYHLPLSSATVLSIGFSGGLQRTSFDMGKSIYPDQPVDPAVANQAAVSKKYSPDLNAGIMLNGKRFFAGISMMQVIPASFVDVPGSESKYKSQLLSSLGYSFKLDEEGTSLWLSGVMKSDFKNPVRYDINAKLRYNNLLWIGASYRKDDAFGTGLGLNLAEGLTAGYMYDWGIDKRVSSYSKGSHEFCLGFRFLKKGQSKTPKMGW